ncbi:MAG: hypothetical protein O3B47_00010 [bacterium]|nr:hypothetical protein [bacterium]
MNQKETGRYIALAGAALVLIGGAFDWDHAAGFHLKAYEAPDWMIAAGAAVIAILFLLIKKIPIWISLFFIAIVIAVGVFDFYAIMSTNSDEGIRISVGQGLYLTIAGGILATIGIISHIVKNKSAE